MPESKRPIKVFLCHASQDKPVVRELSQRLFSEGWIDPWLDEKKLLPGQDWRLKIEEAVETSDIVVICLSSNSVSKEGFVQKELRYAKEIALEKPDETIFLIPLRLDDCETPRGLRFYQWGDYFGEKKDETYTVLLQSLELRYQQKLMLEEKALARQEKERLEREAAENIAREEAKRKKLERETAEKAARDKAEREKAEKAAQEKLELEAAEKARKEETERKAAEKAAQEKEKREAAEKSKRERAERRAAQMTALKETFSKSFNTLRSALANAMPFLRIGAILGIIFVLFWVGSWAMPQIFSLVPTAQSSITLRHTATIASSNSPIPFTKTVGPTATLMSSPTSTKMQTPTATFQPHAITWEGTQISWLGQPISAGNAKELKEISNVRVGIGQSASNILFSQDGKLVIYAIGGTIFIREADTGNMVRTLYHPHTVYCLSFSPDSNLIASTNYTGNGEELRIWRVNDGALFLQKFIGWISCPAFSPDGSLLAFADSKGISIKKASDLTVVGTFPNSGNPAFSPDGNLLAGADSDNIYIWNVKDWTLRLTLQIASGSFVFSPHGDLLASEKDGKISIWNITDGSLVRILEYPSSDLKLSAPLFFLNSEQILVSGLYSLEAGIVSSRLKSYGLWQVSDGVLIRDIRLNEGILGGTVSNDDSTLLFLSGDNYWNYELRSSVGASRFIHFFAVTP